MVVFGWLPRGGGSLDAQIPKGCFRIYFNPQLDIDVFELATIMSHIASGWEARYFGVYVTPKQWEEFGAMKRHWSLDKLEIMR